MPHEHNAHSPDNLDTVPESFASLRVYGQSITYLSTWLESQGLVLDVVVGHQLRGVLRDIGA